MEIYTTAEALAGALAPNRRAGRRIGFVPTMGALHAGHMALVGAAVRETDLTVSSVFVNPTQFNDAGDLRSYPRTPEADARLLSDHGCDILYLPEVADIYPHGTADNPADGVDFGTLTERMEGAQRPGHFAGVAQVVSRLLAVVAPDVLYLGQKDYQQTAVVRALIEQLGLGVQLRVVPTVRETDGLALSSRNRLLAPAERRAAAAINRQLAAVVAGLTCGWPARELERLATEALRRAPLLDPEYVEVFDGRTLLPYRDGSPVEELVVAAAVRVGSVRLIDNRIAARPNP